MEDLKKANEIDPLKRMVERQTQQEEFSPMDPPEAYFPPNLEDVAYDAMHPFLQQLIDEHRTCIKELDSFEEALLHIQNDGIDREADKKLRNFFEFFDNNIRIHNQKEERVLFPLLYQRLLENKEHSNGQDIVTSVDMLEEDHTQALQLAAVVFNFFGLAVRLPNPESRLIVLDAALEHGKQLVELLKLHIFREDNIVFAQAHRTISGAEFDEMEVKMLLRK